MADLPGDDLVVSRLQAALKRTLPTIADVLK